MKSMKRQSLSIAVAMLTASTSFAALQINAPSDTKVLSDGSGQQTPDLNSTSKTKLVRLSNGGPTHGRLISVFSDAWASESFPNGHTVYDVKAQADRPARDIYARYSDDDGVTWSNTVNIANTAANTSSTTLWQGEDTTASAFYGDSDKPNIFNSANNVVVSWVDKFCDGGLQGSIAYVERDMREVPFSCTYAARSIDGGKTWSTPQQLSDGSRDAKQDVNKGSSKAWIVSWQEDPEGLSLGEADGPGDGASGANVSHGTDIWYSYVTTSFADGQTSADSNFGNGTAFTTPTRVTNNWTKMEDKRNTGNEIESGKEGASRANLALVGGTVVMAYEETKGSEGVDEGKYIRYHSFPFNKPPASLENACVTVDGDGKPTTTATDCAAGLAPNTATPERAGCILSKPEQNGRRVRFFAQSVAADSGTKLYIFWKEGEYSQGGPSDIVGRYASDFGDLSSFSPALSIPTASTLDGCLIRGDDDAASPALMGAYANTAAMNLSHDTPNGGDLTADSDVNPIEDARAHRGFIRGNTIILGYSYTSDGIVARDTDLDNYNFWVRRSLDGGATWEAATNVTSRIIDKYLEEHPEYTSAAQINVKEPRIVKTPGNGPATCPTGNVDDETTTDPSECSNPNGFIVATGIVENTYEHLGGGKELDLYITLSTDSGETYAEPIAFASSSAEEFESQIRMTPALDKIFTVWNSNDDVAGKNGHYATLNSAEASSSGGGSISSWALMILASFGLVNLLRNKSIK